MLTIQELRNLSDTEIQTELAKTRRELVRLKLAVKVGQEKATHKVTITKKYVAVINTVIKEFEKESKGKQKEAILETK